MCKYVYLNRPNSLISRLTKLFSEAVAKFRTLKKNAHLVLMQSLEKAVWNWMDNYPHEFTELQKNNNEELTKCCDTFFDLLDNFAESKMKHRHVIWPLQMMLLILTPKVLEEINNADSGAPCSPRHLKKKHFIDAIKNNGIESNDQWIKQGNFSFKSGFDAGVEIFHSETGHFVKSCFHYSDLLIASYEHSFNTLMNLLVSFEITTFYRCVLTKFAIIPYSSVFNFNMLPPNLIIV